MSTGQVRLLDHVCRCRDPHITSLRGLPLEPYLVLDPTAWACSPPPCAAPCAIIACKDGSIATTRGTLAERGCVVRGMSRTPALSALAGASAGAIGVLVQLTKRKGRRQNLDQTRLRKTEPVLGSLLHRH